MSGGAQQDHLTPQIERMAALILSGRLDQGALLARSLAKAFPDDISLSRDKVAVEWLATRSFQDGVPEEWAEAFNRKPTAGTAAVEVAVRRVLARGLVRASEERDGGGGFVGGEPVGFYLLEAGLYQDAAASLFASLARSPRSGRAALHLGNALFHLERPGEARDGYRRAFRVAPGEVNLEEVEDEEVRELAPLAQAFNLSGDVRAWLPAIGYLEDVFTLSALDPVPGAGFGDATRVYDLLIAHKGARSHGERLAIRRDLQALAPVFFASLVESRKLDAASPPYGTA